MTTNDVILFQYTMEPKRVISGTIMDARFSIPVLAGLDGFAVKSFVDSQVQIAAADNVLLYKMETLDGQMVGFFSVQVRNMGLLGVELQRFVRPSFLGFSAVISNLISTFISAGGWRPDYLT